MNAASGRTGTAAFRHSAFRHYMTARVLITSASEMQAVAVAWQVYGITHRPLDLGLVGLAQFLPGVVLFLLAGHTADRFPRRRILQCCYLAFAVCSALLLMLAVQQTRAVTTIYLVLLLNGTVRAFNGPAGQAFLPQLVPEEDFPNAVAWGSSIFQVAMVAGPMIGGLIYGWTGSPVPVYATAAMATLGAALFITLITARVPGRPRSASASDVWGGLEFIWRKKIVLGAISLDLFAVLLGGAVALLPVYAREVLHIGAFGLGILRAAPSVGAVTMAIVLAHWPLKRRVGFTMFACVTGFGVATIVFGLSRSIAVSLVSLFLLGTFDMVSVIVRHTLVQLDTPDEMRGRVSAVNMVFIGASNEVGQFESGLTAQWFGTVPAVVVGGLGTIAIVGLWCWLFPQLRRADTFRRTS